MNDQLKPTNGPGTGESDLKLSIGGVFDNSKRLAEVIKGVSEKYHLVNPGGAIGAELPMLYAVGVAFLFANVEEDTYQIQGRKEVGLSKPFLDRLCGAAGIRWNPNLCGPVDDGRHPFFVEFQVAGPVLQLDGTERMLTGTKRIDLRAERGTDVNTWGADAQEIERTAKDKGREPWPQILQARQHILSLAETKAKSRAIRSLGVKTSYTKEELRKGFAVVRLQFTGRSDDPEITRMVAEKITERALSSAAMLYGEGGQRGFQPAPALPAARVVAKLAVTDDDDDDEHESKKTATIVQNHAPDPANTAKVEAEEQAHDPAAEAKPSAPAPAETKPAAAKRIEPKDDPMLICGKQLEDGSYPRKCCHEFSIEDLKRKIVAYEKKRPEWEPRWKAKNEGELAAMKAWLAYWEFDPNQAELPMGETSDEVRL
jgi:hypothetical protein